MRRSDEDDPRRALLVEHDRLVQLVMLLVDELEHEQLGEQHADARALRAGAGRTLRESITARDAALAQLGLRVAPRLELVD